uniref:Small integral membrane protein 31 n=1 Tax=Pundamilia nyererei TaxID=303518 RepID=A0A3B4G6P4_9CICH
MELPFTGFELTFIIVAFIIFTLFSLASVCFQPQAARPGTHLASDITTETNVSLSNEHFCKHHKAIKGNISKCDTDKQH